MVWESYSLSTSSGDVFNAFLEKWSNIPTLLIEKLVESMPNRFDVVLHATGYGTTNDIFMSLYCLSKRLRGFEGVTINCY